MKALEMLKKGEIDLIYVPEVNKYITCCGDTFYLFSERYFSKINEEDVKRYFKFELKAVLLDEDSEYNHLYLCDLIEAYNYRIEKFEKNIRNSRYTIVEYALDDNRQIFEIEWEVKYLKSLYEKILQEKKDIMDTVNFILEDAEIVDIDDVIQEEDKQCTSTMQKESQKR